MLILIPKEYESLRNSIENDSLMSRGYTRVCKSVSVFQLINPLKSFVVNIFPYDRCNLEELSEAVRYAENIIFIGKPDKAESSSANLPKANPHRYLLSTIKSGEQMWNLWKPLLDSADWTSMEYFLNDNTQFELRWMFQQVKQFRYVLHKCCNEFMLIN